MNMSLVKAYTVKICADTSPKKRLTRTKALVAGIKSYLSNGGHYDADSVAAIIKALLRVTLDSTHTDTEIRDYVISPEVSEVVQSLVTEPVTASDVLRGMTEAVSEPDIGFDGLLTWSAVLANKWFIRPDPTVCPTCPGFVLALFGYRRLCADRQLDITNKRICDVTVDDLLLPLVKGALLTESAESLSYRDTDGRTALHYASAVCLLPQVTAAILSHPEIDVNIKNHMGRTALASLCKRPLDISIPLTIARSLMAHPKQDVSLVDNDNETALAYSLDHISGSTHTMTTVLELLRLITEHPTCTSAMIQRALERLVDWEVASELQDFYTEVVAELAANTKYDIKTQLKDGMTLAHIIATGGVHFTLARPILQHPKQNVSILDNDNKTVMDVWLDHLGGSPLTVTRALELLRLISQHPSCTSAMIQRALERLVDWEAPSELQDLYTEVVTELAGNTKYDINNQLKDGMALAHIAALGGHGDILLKVMDIAGYDPDVQDDVGNTVLYYACASLTSSQALKIIDHPSVTWDFSHTNTVSQTMLDYYRRLPGSKRDPIVMGRLEQKVGGRQAAQSYIPEMVLEFPVRPIQWNPCDLGNAAGVHVQQSTENFVQSKARRVNSDDIYRMEKAAKGRCCIISVPRFEVPWLIPLSGYNTDSQRLGELWSGLGFDVTVASCQGNRCLTVQEIHNSVLEFSQSLTMADQCAVLCVLSHGGEGYIYGSDGNKARLDQLLRLLDNERCPAMAGKPKVVVVQACAGSRNDVGVMASHAPAVSAARTELDLPTMSDFIVCSPSLPGLASYVYDTPSRGSVFLEHFVEVFSQHAREDDINTLMTWVNRDVAKSRTLVASPGVNQTFYKQMSNSHSCLTKLLYFFPCPGGIQGQDWTMV